MITVICFFVIFVAFLSATVEAWEWAFFYLALAITLKYVSQDSD